MAGEREKRDHRNLDLGKDFKPATASGWREAAGELLKGAAYEKILITPTYEGIDIQAIYHREDLKNAAKLDSWPGFPPYLRGTRAAGFPGQSWLIAQQIPAGTAEDFNRLLRTDLENGQTAVNLRLDRPSRRGRDSDAAEEGETGKGGVPISTLEDLQQALKGIEPENIPMLIDAGSSGLYLGAMLAALSRLENRDLRKLNGRIEMDPLGELAENGNLPASLKRVYDEMACLTAWAEGRKLRLRTIAVAAHVYHNAGGSAVEELAFALATGVEYIRAMLKRGLSVNCIAGRMGFAFSLGSDFFMEIAKLRAARLLWYKAVEAFGGDEEAGKMHLHARTSLRNKTIYDPYVNMLRTTTEAMSGIIGGIDSLHVGAFDEVLRLPDEFSRRIARNTQLILKEESRFARVIDPAGGAWFVETLTRQLAESAWQLFQTVEEKGGMYQALIAGFPRERIGQIARKRAKNLALRKDKLVGTNVYANPSEPPPQVQQPDCRSLYQQRCDYLTHCRSPELLEQHRQALSELPPLLTSEPERVMNTVMKALQAGCTLGQVSETLRRTTVGEPAVTALRVERGAPMFERLRRAMEVFSEKGGSPPKVFLANMGALSQYRARAEFSRGFFEIAGFEVIDSPGFADPAEASRNALLSGASVVVICSSDDAYPEIVPPFAARIKEAQPELIVLLAGYPKDQLEYYQSAGADDFIHLHVDAREMLTQLMQKLGVLP